MRLELEKTQFAIHPQIAEVRQRLKGAFAQPQWSLEGQTLSVVDLNNVLLGDTSQENRRVALSLIQDFSGSIEEGFRAMTWPRISWQPI